ncbi:cysteine synthase family protein [Candidatus Solincola tengchongensis]|uniref:PLP-dependent cysteine synthase family protein n=1 Tax=Candidatus Solincola tengchongensis TaxID=2900693 RepID=UPI00257A2EF4|nr:cysteine synthase family protein [Candidatus Solincola tengchongensis]
MFTASDPMKLIGNTPVVKLTKVAPRNPRVEIYAKMEGFNPCSSVKDRIARSMIEGAEKRGELTPEKTIVEASSGNTGIGLAMVAAYKGYRIKIVMPESMSVERRRVMQAFGAEVILTPAEEGMNGAIARAEKMGREPGYYHPNQFANPDNVRAHYEGTGEEILRQVEDIDVLVAGIGTGGTITGVGKRLREVYPDITIVGVEPYPRSLIQGLRNLQDFLPPILDLSIIDRKVNVEDGCAFNTVRVLANIEGLFVGMSSGAAVHAALQVAEEMERGRVVVILPDRGDRYLSTDCFACTNLECVYRDFLRSLQRENR